MTSMDYIIENEKPTSSEFSDLREKVGWGNTDLEMAQISLENSLFHVTVRAGSKLIGMARVIGDGVMFFYVQDVVVDPDFQKQGVGKMLMNSIEEYLSNVVKKGATVALLAAKGQEPFYTRYGYLERSGEPLGKAMCKFI